MSRVTTRVTVDLTAHDYALITELVDLTDSSTKADVVRRAMKVLKVIVDAEREGSTIVIREKNGQECRVVFL